MKRFTLGVFFLVASWAANLPADAPPPAQKFLGLFEQLRAAQAPNAHQNVAFRFSDSEINDYMLYSLRVTPRPGLQSVTVKIFPQNYISTYTVVDFDAVERWHPGTIPTLLKPILNGKKTIWVDYRIDANNYKITFSVEKAYYQDIRLPAFFVNKMIQIVAARQPEKYDTSKPMPIPFGLKQIWTSDHVVQGRNY
jgi:hypothetical protein